MDMIEEFVFGRTDVEAHRDLRRTRWICGLVFVAVMASPFHTNAYRAVSPSPLFFFIVAGALLCVWTLSRQGVRKTPDTLWKIDLLSECVILRRLWSGPKKVGFDQIGRLTVRYGTQYCSYDRLELTVMAAGEAFSTGPCRLAGERVEAAAEALRRHVRGESARCGSAAEDRLLRLGQLREANRLSIVGTLVFILACLAGFAWIARHIPEDLHFRFTAVETEATRENEWSYRYAYSVAPGVVRHGSSAQLWRVSREKGDTFPIRYSPDDPDQSRLVIELPVLSSKMYGLLLILGLSTIALTVSIVQSCRGDILCYARRRLFYIHPGELEDDYLRPPENDADNPNYTARDSNS